MGRAQPAEYLARESDAGSLRILPTGTGDRLSLDLAGARALDIGCGGAFLAEEFARLGWQVVGVNPSAVSIETAQRHVLEHVSDLDAVLSETAQVLKPAGSFLFNTITLSCMGWATKTTSRSERSRLAGAGTIVIAGGASHRRV